MISEFFVDEVLVVEYFFDVFFWIVIELNNKKKDHGEEVLKGDAVGRFGALPGEELIEELNFLLFGGFEYFDFVILVLPIPLMNSGSEIYWVESVSNSSKSLSPHSPFLWKKRRKLSILRACSLILFAKSSYTR